jgi:hypothetical protein
MNVVRENDDLPRQRFVRQSFRHGIPVDVIQRRNWIIKNNRRFALGCCASSARNAASAMQRNSPSLRT